MCASGIAAALLLPLTLLAVEVRETYNKVAVPETANGAVEVILPANGEPWYAGLRIEGFSSGERSVVFFRADNVVPRNLAGHAKTTPDGFDLSRAPGPVAILLTLPEGTPVVFRRSGKEVLSVTSTKDGQIYENGTRVERKMSTLADLSVAIAASRARQGLR